MQNARRQLGFIPRDFCLFVSLFFYLGLLCPSELRLASKFAYFELPSGLKTPDFAVCCMPRFHDCRSFFPPVRDFTESQAGGWLAGRGRREGMGKMLCMCAVFFPLPFFVLLMDYDFPLFLLLSTCCPGDLGKNWFLWRTNKMVVYPACV
jgi:hypothetical protein